MMNQDEVAQSLIRVPAEQMHMLIADFGSNKDNGPHPWYRIARNQSTEDFLISHGWTLLEYSRECYSRVSKRDLFYPRFHTFANLFRHDI